MSDVVQFSGLRRPRPASPSPSKDTGQILLFTGVRIERYYDILPADYPGFLPIDEEPSSSVPRPENNGRGRGGRKRRDPA